MVRIITLAAIALGSPAAVAYVSAAAPPASPAATAAKGAGGAQVVCKYVVSAQPGSKPFQMCLAKSEWAQRDAKARRDANRIECRYQEVPGSKFKSKKICQPASTWAEHRRLEREEVDRIQRGVCVPGGGC